MPTTVAERGKRGKGEKETVAASRQSAALLNPLSDDEHEEFERLANASIHELVFACQLAGQNDFADARNALCAAWLNLDKLAFMINEKDRP